MARGCRVLIGGRGGVQILFFSKRSNWSPALKSSHAHFNKCPSCSLSVALERPVQWKSVCSWSLGFNTSKLVVSYLFHTGSIVSWPPQEELKELCWLSSRQTVSLFLTKYLQSSWHSHPPQLDFFGCGHVSIKLQEPLCLNTASRGC